MNRENKGSGKWCQLGVPHKGWACTGIEDLGTSEAICQMCETQPIRYVHYMAHPDYSDVLGVGCVCAEHMEENYERAKTRERNLKNAAQRKKNWLKRQWRVSQIKGNPYLNTDGYNIVIFKKFHPLGLRWSFRITESESETGAFSQRLYESEDQAKLAAFDAMINLKG
ncbi:MAG: hypothetical protein IH886_04455 [Nitrospinae bacterium]|nr:hypothetical protein [Nitrospinota bacterium]